MDEVKDSNGAILKDGDAVTLIKDLKVKGSSVTLKRGTRIKNIRLTNDPAEIECNADKVKGADVPKKWTDLLDPKFKGRVATGHPAFSGCTGV